MGVERTVGVVDCRTTVDPLPVTTCRRTTTIVRGAGAGVGTVVVGAGIVGDAAGAATNAGAGAAAITAAMPKVPASAAPPTTSRVAAAACCRRPVEVRPAAARGIRTGAVGSSVIEPVVLVLVVFAAVIAVFRLVVLVFGLGSS